MRHFIAYHNAKKMGYPSTALTDPHVKTGNSVKKLEGVTVWLIAGEGKSPKRYYLASKFTAVVCEEAKFPGSKLSNQISGGGSLFKLTKPLNGTPLLAKIISSTANFRKGFHEIADPAIVKDLLAIV